MGTEDTPEKSRPGTTPRQPSAGPEFISPAVFRSAVVTLMLYFGARLLYYALSISSFVPPDEVTHAQISQVFSTVWLAPQNSPATWELGPVTNIPWLYYWMMGKLLHLNVFGVSGLVFLRLLNIPLAFGTIWYLDRTLRLLTGDRLTRLLLLAVATNLGMFTLLSASVSYDNLANLLAAMAIYYEFAFLRERSGGGLAASWLCQLLGALTKVTFLPLILLLNVVLILFEAKRLPRLASGVGDYFRKSRGRAVAMAALLLLFLGLNLQLYAGNYLTYHTINPTMEMLTSKSAAMNYRMAARGMIFDDFRDGKISYMDALVLAGEIKHPGDKADTFYLLMNWQKLQQNPSLWMGPAAYSWFWFKTMIGTTLGIKAHLGMFKSQGYLVPIYLLAGLGVVGFVLYWRPRRSGWEPLAMAGIVLSYAAIVMYRVNWDSYQNYGEPGITLYGRYLFPLFAPMLALWAHYLSQLFRPAPVRLGLAIAVALLFIGYDFPWFLAHATPEWFR
ncbi:hypothetical protein [Geomesophilobacter sediminis]|uniref:Uncharacterized protein n=1 Tax=Geomesophilobacter sediminis TaxID=2798584 RepID=A0A8J7M281_9BACT|nr:hypothetical protein [Geomesophilobacter sediminis]MBJ6727292.1 hypothetical protein [Geomesophilobacter sediminis]